jgi:CheY-like chemotaxis protein
MKKGSRPETHPVLQSRLSFVEQRMRRTRRQLERRTRRALVPLEIQETVGISEIKGDVLIVSNNPHVQQKVETTLQSETYQCDVAQTGIEAIGYMKLGNYRMVILDRTQRGRSQVFRYIERYRPHIKVISIVNDQDRARESMVWGGYSFLLSADFDPEQLRTCLISSLQLNHRVCQILANGQPCNRSCINNYQWVSDPREMEHVREYARETEHVTEMEHVDQDFDDVDPLQTEQSDFFEELEEVQDEEVLEVDEEELEKIQEERLEEVQEEEAQEEEQLELTDEKSSPLPRGS